MSRSPDSHWERVRGFWNARSCGETYAAGTTLRDQLDRQAATRYELEPYIPAFARFGEGADLDVLEIGTGMGADHLRWAEAAPKRLVGLDATERGATFTASRLALHALVPRVVLGDAHSLPFSDAAFDLVYSWGVLHHVHDTGAAINEVRRVLRPGGIARVMLYHRRSYVGLMMWIRFGLLRLRPWRPLTRIFAEHFESPGTQAFTAAEARRMFSRFSAARVRPSLSFVDLLLGAVGQQHQGVWLRMAKAAWPRGLIRRIGDRHGFYLLIEARR